MEELSAKAPLLRQALVGFDCRVESILDAGSHAIVIGNIEAVRVRPGEVEEPLCYIDGKWATLSPLA